VNSPRAALAAVVAAVTLATSFIAEAQRPGKVYRVGFLGNSTALLEEHLVGAFRSGLRDLGYDEGRNVLLEYRWAEGKYERFPALIAELMGLRVDVLVTAGAPATLAVKKATTSIPLVMVAVADPVGDGIVSSLAHPGGNITGVSSIALDLEAKRLELLREVMPTAASIAVLWNPLNVSHPRALERVQAAARVLRMKVHLVRVRVADDIKDAFADIGRQRSDALLVLADRVFLHERARMMELALHQRLPGVYPYRELVETGGLMSFGPNYVEMHRRAATYVDRILKGAKPGDLPIEQPTTFELVINTRTAKALGLTIPPSVLLRTDQLIQ
jgi:putative ABC transport system substrate-binding protein